MANLGLYAEKTTYLLTLVEKKIASVSCSLQIHSFCLAKRWGFYSVLVVDLLLLYTSSTYCCFSSERVTAYKKLFFFLSFFLFFLLQPFVLAWCCPKQTYQTECISSCAERGRVQIILFFFSLPSSSVFWRSLRYIQGCLPVLFKAKPNS